MGAWRWPDRQCGTQTRARASSSRLLGNALLHRGERPDAAVQQANIDRVATALAALAQEHELVITHGNGPQIGLLAMESAADPALSAPYPWTCWVPRPRA